MLKWAYSSIVGTYRVFLQGSYIAYAHSVLQRQCGLVYTAQWAEANFPDRKAKNNFYTEFGKKLSPNQEDNLNQFGENDRPKDILNWIKK